MSIKPQQMEMFVASQFTESLGGNPDLLGLILKRQNMLRALQRVRDNKGAPGVDKMTVSKISGYLKRHWPKIKKDILNGTYKPLPVKRKEIPKPTEGCVSLVFQQCWTE
jgi:RNA-directed DNA polymerase